MRDHLAETSYRILLNISPISFHERLERYPYGVSRLPYLDGVQHAGVSQLCENAQHVELHSGLVGVGFDAANKPGVTPGHGLQQLVEAVREPGQSIYELNV